MAHRVREAIAYVLGEPISSETRHVYDVAHNVAKLEEHAGRTLCVQRKGATRAFPAGAPDFRAVGQPVFIPGSMGTASFVLRGRPGSLERSFGSACHGAGRRISRTGARKKIHGAELRRQLEADGIVVRCASNRGLRDVSGVPASVKCPTRDSYLSACRGPRPGVAPSRARRSPHPLKPPIGRRGSSRCGAESSLIRWWPPEQERRWHANRQPRTGPIACW
jgi:hypothetical protein